MALSKKAVDIFTKSKDILRQNNLLTSEELELYEKELNKMIIRRQKDLIRQRIRNQSDTIYWEITKKISYYKKAGNVEKEQYWRNEFKKHKESKEEQ